MDTAAKYGIKALYDRNIAELSGGEKQKAALVSLLTAKGSFLILDEPLTDMDPASQELILELLEDYPGTLIVFEQSVDFYPYFDRIILLKEGSILADAGRETAALKSVLESCGLTAPPVFSITGQFSRNIREAAAQALDIYGFDPVPYSDILSTRKNTAENLIEIQNLSFKYPGSDQYALENVSLDIRKGDFIVLIGENGSGKTTLMKLTAGIYKNFAKGQILYKGEDMTKQKIAGEITYVYQNPDNQIFAETVYDEIAFALRTRGETEETIREKVFSIMELFSVTDKKDADPFSLPKGDREKIACASVLVAGPEVIILDEPTTGLDTASVKALMEIITGLNQKGKTVIIITHSMETASSYGYKTAAMAGGKLLFHGDKREFFKNTPLLERVKAKRTPLMDLSLEMNQAFLLNEDEFKACWKKK
jgi:energy-coupling factor transport system ATP-binding protein